MVIGGHWSNGGHRGRGSHNGCCWGWSRWRFRRSGFDSLNGCHRGSGFLNPTVVHEGDVAAEAQQLVSPSIESVSLAELLEKPLRINSSRRSMRLRAARRGHGSAEPLAGETRRGLPATWAKSCSTYCSYSKCWNSCMKTRHGESGRSARTWCCAVGPYTGASVPGVYHQSTTHGLKLGLVRRHLRVNEGVHVGAGGPSRGWQRDHVEHLPVVEVAAPRVGQQPSNGPSS